MGPTEVVPGTHTAEAHAARFSRGKPRRAPLSPSPVSAADAGEAALIASGTLLPYPRFSPLGDALLMDSRTVHRGSSHVTERARLEARTRRFSSPRSARRGARDSLLEEYAGRFRLGAHERWRG